MTWGVHVSLAPTRKPRPGRTTSAGRVVEACTLPQFEIVGDPSSDAVHDSARLGLGIGRHRLHHRVVQRPGRTLAPPVLR
jgi:hypothetical protein